MTTKQNGGKITGLLALTVEALEAINFDDPIHVVGDYEVEKADGTRPILGYASVINRGRLGDSFGTSVNNAVVPGDITVEAIGFMVVKVKAGAPLAAGVAVGVGSDSKHYALVNPGAPVNEIQTLTEGGSGLTSFTVTFNGETTAAISDSATANDVRDAIAALDNVGAGNVSVTGSGPWVVTFVGALAGVNVPAMNTTPTGGTGTVVVTTGTSGAGTTIASSGLSLTSALAADDMIDVLVR